MKSDYIQIKDKFYQECDIIMLATEKAQKNSLCLTAGSKLILLDGKDWETVNNVAGFRPQHLYILSDEEIKEGDWVLTKKYNNPVKANKFIKSIGWYYSNTLVNDICPGKKIIATTDEYISRENTYTNKYLFDTIYLLPTPSDDFLRVYVEKQGKIDKVLVEYVGYGFKRFDLEGKPRRAGYQLKVVPDNTITIKPIQEEKTSWSRKEVIQLFSKYQYDYAQWVLRMENDINGKPIPIKWIKENL